MLYIFALSMFTTALAKRRNSNREQGQKNECQNLSVQEDFDASRFMGMWYEILSYPFCLTNNAKCIASTYAFGSGRNISIYSRFMDHKGFENRIIGMAAEKNPGIFAVMFPAARRFSNVWAYYVLKHQLYCFFSAEATSFHIILSTNYENYAVVASCNTFCGPVDLNVWVLSRKPYIEPKFFVDVFEALKENEISYSSLRRTVQDCNFSFMF